MPQPQPGNLDHGRSQPGIAGLGDALVPMDRSALPRRRGQPRISRNLLSVAERAEQALRPERGGRFRSNTSQRQQLGRWRWHAGARLRLGQPGIPLGFDSLDLFDHEFEPIELPADLGLQALRKGATTARDQFLEPLSTIAGKGSSSPIPWPNRSPLMRLTCRTRSAVRVSRSRLIRRRSSSWGVGAWTIAQTRGSPRLSASSARTRASPSIRSVFARRRRRDVAIEAGSTTWLSIPSFCRTRWIQNPSSPASWMTRMGKTCPVRARAFSLSWDKRARRAAMSPLGTACLDIFSPPPGAREVMTQVERLSSRDTKIALRSVRTAVCSSGRGQRAGMAAPAWVVQHPHSAREQDATNRAHGIFGPGQPRIRGVGEVLAAPRYLQPTPSSPHRSLADGARRLARYWSSLRCS